MNDRTRMENYIININSSECDSIFRRLFKSESDYFEEGCKVASDVYSRIIGELNLEFRKRFYGLEITNEVKQTLINQLIFVISKQRKDNSDDNNDERIKLLRRCLDVFNDDVNSFSANDMKYLSLDKEFSDWRNVYGISKKY